MKLTSAISCAALAASISFPLGVSAQEDPSATAGALCAEVADSLARLTCFDRAFPKAASPSEIAEVEEIETAADEASLWAVDASTSAIDDSPTLIATLQPTTASGTGFGTKSAWLFIRCIENTTSVVLGTSMFMTDETVAVTIRLDDKPASTARWDRSTDYKAVGLWSGSTAIPFIKELAETEQLVVRIQASDRVDAVFALGDIEQVASQVADACQWQL